MAMKGDAKFEEKLTCDLKNDMRNVTEHLKYKNWEFDGIL